ncbi:hypothetical protein RTP6_007516 [Batrachochytrium dendrobatidis]
MGEWESVEPRKSSKSFLSHHQDKTFASPKKVSTTPTPGSPAISLSSGSPRAQVKNRSFYAALSEVSDSMSSNKTLTMKEAVVPDVMDLPKTPTKGVGSSRIKEHKGSVSAVDADQNCANVPSTTSLRSKHKPLQASAHTGMQEMCHLSLDKLKASIHTIRQQSNADPIRDLCESIEMMINTDLKIALPPFSSKLFELEFYRPGRDQSCWRGPMPFVSEKVAQELLKYTLDCRPEILENGLVSIGKDLVEGQKKANALSTSNTFTTIGNQLLIQIIAMSHPHLFFGHFNESADKQSPAKILLKTYSSTLFSNPAVGHTMLWIFAQQSVVFSDRIREPHPKSLEYWFTYFVPIFVEGYENTTTGVLSTTTSKSKATHTEEVNSNAAISIQKNSLVYAEYLLDRLEARLFSTEKTKISLPFIKAEQMAQLFDAAFKHDASSNKRRKMLDHQTRLRLLFTKIKNQMFDSETPNIATESHSVVFLTFLKKLGTVTDKPGVDMIVSVLGEILAIATRQSTVTRNSKTISPDVLTTWVDQYSSHTHESNLLVEYLYSDFINSKTSWLAKQNAGFCSDIDYSKLKSSLMTMMKSNKALHLQDAPKKSLHIKGKKMHTTFKSVDHELDPDAIMKADSADKLFKKFLKALAQDNGSKCFYFATFLSALFGILLTCFVYYTLVHVACDPMSSRSQVVCPVDAIQLHKSLQQSQLWILSEADFASHRVDTLRNQTVQLTKQVWKDIADHHALTNFVKTVKDATGLSDSDIKIATEETYRIAVHVPGQVLTFASLQWHDMLSSESFIHVLDVMSKQQAYVWKNFKLHWHLAAVYVVDDVIPRIVSTGQAGMLWVSQIRYSLIRQSIAEYARRGRKLVAFVNSYISIAVQEKWHQYQMAERMTEFRSSILQSNYGNKMLHLYDSQIHIGSFYASSPRYYCESFVQLSETTIASMQMLLHSIWRCVENDISETEWQQFSQYVASTCTDIQTKVLLAFGVKTQ